MDATKAEVKFLEAPNVPALTDETIEELCHSLEKATDPEEFMSILFPQLDPKNIDRNMLFPLHVILSTLDLYSRAVNNLDHSNAHKEWRIMENNRDFVISLIRSQLLFTLVNPVKRDISTFIENLAVLSMMEEEERVEYTKRAENRMIAFENVLKAYKQA